MRLNPFVADNASAAPTLRKEIVITMSPAIMHLSLLIQFQPPFCVLYDLLTEYQVNYFNDEQFKGPNFKDYQGLTGVIEESTAEESPRESFL